MHYLIFSAALAVGVADITPTVVLVKKPDALAQLLPGATRFFTRERNLAGEEAHRLHEALDWGPEGDKLTFYLGRRAETLVGAALFVRVDTPHGPIEVAVGFDEAGAVRDVLVTRATVETRRWVEEALRADLATAYRRLEAGGTPAGAEAVKGRVGRMAAYMARQVDRGVARAIVAYGEFYRN